MRMTVLKTNREFLRVFAARPDPGAFVDVLPWVLLLLAGIGVVIAAAYLLRFLRHWKLDDPDNETTLLARFRELHRAGKLSFEEFREIQLNLAEQMERRSEERHAKKGPR